MSPDSIAALLSQGLVTHKSGNLDQACEIYQQVLQAHPHHARALHLLALASATQGRAQEANSLFLKTLEVDSSDVTVFSNFARFLLNQGELSSALDTARQGMAKRWDVVPLHCVEGAVYLGLGQASEALAAYERARLVDQSSAEALQGLASSLVALGSAPCSEFDQGIVLLDSLTYYLREGELFFDAGAYRPAASCFRICCVRDARNQVARTMLVLSLMHSCAWADLGELLGDVSEQMRYGDIRIPPFSLLALVDDPQAHLKRARGYFKSGEHAWRSQPLRRPSRRRSSGARLKVAYVSADFHDHATSRLLVDVIEAHSRSALDVVAVSYGPDDHTPMRHRVEQAFDVFVDARTMTDQEIAQALLDMCVDIVVDVKGLTNGGREQLFLMRPAPVAVSFLAYPGSMGSKAYDYILGDAVVTPFSDAFAYDEHIVQLPGSYQSNGTTRPEPTERPSRDRCGLPSVGIVFAAFNNPYKIQECVFDTWMRILRRVPASVLWLTCDDVWTQNNLRNAAALQGVDPFRLVFAPKLPWHDHLQRLQTADLFLDTWPYNAHTTASDALWMGLPVVTRTGKSFASRVAASLLKASDLDELVTHNESQYEDLAVKLASSPADLQALRDRVARLRTQGRLFESSRFAANLEQAYVCMAARAREGLPPQAFEVRDIEEGGGYRLPDTVTFAPVPRLTS